MSEDRAMSRCAHECRLDKTDHDLGLVGHRWAAPRAATEPPPTFDTPLYRKAVLDVVKRWDMGPEAAAEVIEALDRARRSHVHTPKQKPGAANAFCDSCGFFPLPSAGDKAEAPR